jgi:hypothetical protein
LGGKAKPVRDRLNERSPFSVSTDVFPFATILCRLGVGLCGAQSIAVAEFHVVRPIFVVAPNLVSADRTSRKRAEFAVRSVLRCHQLVRNRPHTRVFRLSVGGLQTEKDSMVERSEFEPPVPLSKLPDNSLMLSFATSRRVVKRSQPGLHFVARFRFVVEANGANWIAHSGRSRGVAHVARGKRSP